MIRHRLGFWGIFVKNYHRKSNDANAITPCQFFGRFIVFVFAWGGNAPKIYV